MTWTKLTDLRAFRRLNDVLLFLHAVRHIDTNVFRLKESQAWNWRQPLEIITAKMSFFLIYKEITPYSFANWLRSFGVFWLLAFKDNTVYVTSVLLFCLCNCYCRRVNLLVVVWFLTDMFNTDWIVRKIGNSSPYAGLDKPMRAIIRLLSHWPHHG